MLSRPTKVSAKSKGKAKAAPAPAALPKQKKSSNRPRNSPSPQPSSASGDDDEDDEDINRARMLAALQAHQQSFLSSALPSTSRLLQNSKGKQEPAVKQQKAIWEMDMDDFDDEDAATDDESDEEDAGDLQGRPAPETIAFQDPGRASAATVVAFEEPRLGAEGAVGSHRDMRDFMSSKVKNSRKTVSVADIANAKHKGKPRKDPNAGSALGEEEESHLSTLDSHLSTLLRPLIAPTSTSNSASQLPQLLSTLPLTSAKPLKGHTPLPGNAPRNLRAGQSAKNLERAQKRDEAAGVLAGSKRGRVGEREALTLREKRREDAGEGGVKRQRGLKGAVGRLGGGELRLSREDIERVQGGGASARGGKKGGRGGSMGGGRGGAAGGRGKARK